MIRILTFTFSVSHVQIEYLFHLVFSFITIRQEIVDQQFFTNHNSWLVDYVVKFTIVLFKDFIFIVILVFIIFKILLSDIETRSCISVFLVILSIKLLQDVLDLFLKLII